MSQSSATDAKIAFAFVRVLLGVTLGWGIWAMSPIVTGEVEPWDATSQYYSGSLFIAGMLSTLFWRGRFYWGPLGIFLGQTAFLCMKYPQGGIFPAPLAVALFGTIQPLIGALLGWGIGYGIYVAFKNDFAAKVDVNHPDQSINTL